MKRNWIIGITLALLISLLAACGDDNASDNQTDNEADKQQETEAPEQPKAPEPDMSEIPDVVAEVNGEKITKEDFKPVYVSTLNNYSVQGLYDEKQDKNGEMEKQIQQQTVEQLIGQQLLIQEAEKRDLEASDKEVNEKITSLKEQFGSDEQFEEALKSSKVTEEDLASDLKKQVKIQKLVKDETGTVKVSEKEVKDMYKQMTEAQKEGNKDEEGKDKESKQEIPSFEELKPQIEAQLKSQKEGEEIQKLVDKLRENGDVTVNL
ncbi:SurA N-terminal domain-containing protein [Bacillus piscicola]|uniref:SurA N-terminal domain-containing protein n=1 Tax=Bacillus piscicola TaxID=1632684 RepID=UPI001F08D400|nr:SurA N-terminal domain-containing protein [Bacillus piscicola]